MTQHESTLDISAPLNSECLYLGDITFREIAETDPLRAIRLQPHSMHSMMLHADCIPFLYMILQNNRESCIRLRVYNGGQHNTIYTLSDRNVMD